MVITTSDILRNQRNRPIFLQNLIIIRLINAWWLNTFFQPDEFFQSLEPAWQLAFGPNSGAWLTWVCSTLHTHTHICVRIYIYIYTYKYIHTKAFSYMLSSHKQFHSNTHTTFLVLNSGMTGMASPTEVFASPGPLLRGLPHRGLDVKAAPKGQHASSCHCRWIAQGIAGSLCWSLRLVHLAACGQHLWTK